MEIWKMTYVPIRILQHKNKILKLKKTIYGLNRHRLDGT